MKKILATKRINIIYILASLAMLLSACSEEIFSPSHTDGELVSLSLDYSDVSPKDIVINTRATAEEEKQLDNLYIYIFNGEGKLKGFKKIEGKANLDQNTSSTNRANISDIITRSGDAYIYAVANVNTNLYPVTTSDEVEDGKLPIGLEEHKAANGYYDFTKDQLLALSFNRNASSIDITDKKFLMSGSVNNGQAITINTDGSIAETDKDIRLTRIVSKVEFNIGVGSGDGITRTFKLNTYDIMNIALDGSLVGSIDGNAKQLGKNVNNVTGLIPGVNDVDKDGKVYLMAYLPENLQDAKSPVTLWHEREADGNENKDAHAFLNAPDKGTYLVLKGTYSETGRKDGTNSITRDADVTYYVHLGDCSRVPNDYNLERNCNYTFNITINGVGQIIVEAKKEAGEETKQPGAEGVVLEYGSTNKNMTLDSHYEYMVMRFYQNDIINLKKAGLGYYYQVYALGKHTDPILIKESIEGNINGVDTSWIEFAMGGDYNSDAKERGNPCDYPGKQNLDKGNYKLYSINRFLKEMYDNAEAGSNYWTGYDRTTKRRYLDATCFISENYYPNLTWNQYVNDVPKRSFFVANNVWVSKDERSVYAKAQYGVQQYNIQTFYDRKQAGSVVAYGCETINDEENNGYTVAGNNGLSGTSGTDTWNGRNNFIKDIQNRGSYYTWADLKNTKSLVRSCISRNRDLNGDGKITEDEVRWYAPTSSQLAGFWIGESIISTEAKLYNKSTSSLELSKDQDNRMLYYTATKGINTFFSEEGMATNNNNKDYPPAYVRCVRNLKSNDEGYSATPDTYYTFNKSNYYLALDKIDESALDVTGSQQEQAAFDERTVGANKPAKKFYIASANTGTPSMRETVTGQFNCYGNYSQNNDSKTWRVPNQREFSLIFIVNRQEGMNWGLNWTYCRALFSNQSFRYSWTVENDVNYRMVAPNRSDLLNKQGSVRCIKVVK